MPGPPASVLSQLRAYISRHPPPVLDSSVHDLPFRPLFSYSFFLSLLKHRKETDRSLQWLCFLDHLPSCRVHHHLLAPSPNGPHRIRRVDRRSLCRSFYLPTAVFPNTAGPPRRATGLPSRGCCCWSSCPMRKRSFARVHRPSGRPPHSRPPDGSRSWTRFPMPTAVPSLLSNQATLASSPTRPDSKTPRSTHY